MEHKYRIIDGNGKFYRGEENGGGWTEVMDEAKVYDSQKELPAALLNDEGEVCMKKKIRFVGISGYTSIRYFPERSGNGGSDRSPILCYQGKGVRDQGSRTGRPDLHPRVHNRGNFFENGFEKKYGANFRRGEEAQGRIKV
jgi:hypothetical protein